MPFIATTNTVYQRYLNNKIKSITILRSPLSDNLMSAIKTAGGKDFVKALEKLPYDKLYHLRIEVGLDNGKKIIVEKSKAVIIITEDLTREANTESLKIGSVPDITLKTMMEKTKAKMGAKFYPYQAFTNNCEDFVLAILESNGMGDLKYKDFIKQDVKTLITTPYFRKIINTITDVGAIGATRIAKGKNIFNRIHNPVQTIKEISRNPSIIYEFL
jgi:hypothetical protein